MKSLVEALEANKELIDWAIVASSLQTGALADYINNALVRDSSFFFKHSLSARAHISSVDTPPCTQNLLSKKSPIRTRYGKSQGLATLPVPFPLHRLPP